MSDITFKRTQFVNSPLNEVFYFFSEAKNLETITPPYLNFKILKTSTADIQKGTLIDYQLKLHGIPFKWKTHIKDFQQNKMFIDEQIKGPYKKWIHTHSFKEKDGGTLIEDHVVYKIPLGGLGKLLLGKYIKSDLEKIFSYREKIIEEYFKKS